MPVKLAVFDIAGTTIADDNAVFEVFRNAFQLHGYRVSESLINPLMGYKKPAAIKMVLEQLNEPADEARVNAMHDFFENEMIEHYRHSSNIIAVRGAEEVMRALKTKGIRIALNTGFSRVIAESILQRMKWVETGLVDDFIASDEVENGRPHPDMIRKLMQRASISDAREVIKIGDTEVDIREGRNAGCSLVIAVTTGAFTREQLQAYHPDHIIELSELPHILFARA